MKNHWTQQADAKRLAWVKVSLKLWGEALIQLLEANGFEIVEQFPNPKRALAWHPCQHNWPSHLIGVPLRHPDFNIVQDADPIPEINIAITRDDNGNAILAYWEYA